MPKNNDELELFESYKEFCKSLSETENVDMFVSYIFYLMKKYNYDYKKYNKPIFCFDENANPLGRQPIGFQWIVKDLLKDPQLTEDEREIVNEVLSKTKLIMNTFLNSFIEEDVALKEIFYNTPINTIKEYIDNREKLNYNDEAANFKDFGIKSLEKGKTSLTKPLICTDNNFLVKFAIEGQIECDILLDNPEDVLLYKMKVSVLNLTHKIRIEFDNILSNTFFQNKYKKIILCYTKNLKLSQARIDKVLSSHNNIITTLSNQPAISNDYFYLNSAYKYLDKNGKILSLMSDITLYKIANKNIRKELVEKGLIEEVRTIRCIDNNFNLVQFSFNNENIKFIDDRESNLIDLNPDINELSLAINKINQEYDLRVKKESDSEQISYYNPKPLGELVEDCYRGCQFSINNFFCNKGKYELLTVSDVEDGMIGENLKKFNFENTKIEKYFLKDGDILISSHGSQIKIAVVDNIENRKIMPNGNFVVIRLNKNKLNPYYLEAYLNSTIGKKLLLDISTGTKNRIISQYNAKKILISMLDIEKQNQLAKKFKNKKDDIKFMKKYLSKLQEECKNFFENEILEEFDCNNV